MSTTTLRASRQERVGARRPVHGRAPSPPLQVFTPVHLQFTSLQCSRTLPTTDGFLSSRAAPRRCRRRVHARRCVAVARGGAVALGVPVSVSGELGPLRGSIRAPQQAPPRQCCGSLQMLARALGQGCARRALAGPRRVRGRSPLLLAPYRAAARAGWTSRARLTRRAAQPSQRRQERVWQLERRRARGRGLRRAVSTST